jgi:hypothetical protein
MAELWSLIAGRPLRSRTATGRDLLRLAQETLAARFAAAQAAGDGGVRDLLDRWQRRAIEPTRAAAELLRLLQGSEGRS